ncbi:hypothetical protein HY448_00500 [Candidatus Pacearchaeota archaeon]|nr:hypothetical protein [Candidatus Pacearchaeota archaeon]
MEEQKTKKTFSSFYDKYYKLFLILPAMAIIFSLIYMFFFYSTNGDLFYKDFSLTGGTSITILGKIDGSSLKNSLSDKLDGLNTIVVYDISTREQTALIVQTKTDTEEVKKILESYLGYSLDGENSSVEFISSALGQSFYQQLLIAIFVSFFLMASVIFLIFRNFVPSFAVIISAFADILMTMVAVNLLGIKISGAGIVAFLMLIGYSVDTDILLTNRLLKRYHEGTINTALFGAFKTGMTMTLAALLAIIFALIVSSFFSVVLTQIFTILMIGLFLDIFNTWITNASLLKWHLEKK